MNLLVPSHDGNVKWDSTATAPLVHVVDSDKSTPDTLTEIFKSVDLSVKFYTSAEVFLAEYDPNVAGCVVADLYLSGMSGLALQKHLREHQMVVPLLILTRHADVPMVVEAMGNGAFNVLLKPPHTHELVESVHKAIRFDQAHRQENLCRLDIIDRFTRLSTRENEVLNMVLDGSSNKQIAAQLGISFRTVESHRANTKHKLDAHSLAELFELAFQYRSINDLSRNS